MSVVIPAYNSAQFVGATLQSVLGQSRCVDQIVVVNDGSTDEMDAAVAPFVNRIEYVKQANQGVSAARNCGLERVRSQFVIFLDADDQLTPDAVKNYLAFAAQLQSPVAFYGDYVPFDAAHGERRSNARPYFAGDPPEPARAIFRIGGHTPSAFMVSVDLARTVGGFDRRFSSSADSHFFMRCGTLAPFVYVPHVVVRYQLHDGNMSKQTRHAIEDSVDSRLAYLEWCRVHGHAVIEDEPTESQMFTDIALGQFHLRNWADLDITLTVASERRIHHPALDRVRRLRRLPAWVFRMKDYCDEARRRKSAPIVSAGPNAPIRSLS